MSIIKIHRYYVIQLVFSFFIVSMSKKHFALYNTGEDDENKINQKIYFSLGGRKKKCVASFMSFHARQNSTLRTPRLGILHISSEKERRRRTKKKKAEKYYSPSLFSIANVSSSTFAPAFTVT